MYCAKCGNELIEGARFCKSCGSPVIYPASVSNTSAGQGSFANDPPVSSRPGMDSRLQCLLSVLIGLTFLILHQVFMTVMFARLGSYYLTAAQSMMLLTDFFVCLMLAVGIVFVLLRFGRSEKARKKLVTAGTLTLIAVQLQFMLCLFLQRYIFRWFNPPFEVYEARSLIVRAGCIFLILFTVAAILVGCLVRRKSLLLILLIDAGVFLFSVIAQSFSFYVLHLGLFIPSMWFNALQPLVVLLPCLGDWKEPGK